MAGETLLVFGARHLGRAIARDRAAAGWNVAAVALGEETIAALREAVPNALGIVADVTRPADVERAFAETIDRFGAVDLVVNVVSPRPRGAFRGGTLAEAPDDAMAPYVEELLPAVFNVLRIGCRALGEQGSGTIVQVTGGSSHAAARPLGSLEGPTKRDLSRARP